MARALSSVDTGASSSSAGDPSSSSTSTGGAGSSSYWADLDKYADGDFDPSDLFPSYNRTDKALALVRLGLGCCFIVLGTYALVRFYRSRWILDIRTRYAVQILSFEQGTGNLLASCLFFFWFTKPRE